ncbi:hypothetical protein C475_00560 [Halosimplex carlsbadense 2-9-1]|uniref:Uncharacterized protein n=1 Tax=Halosimplex carlsbadense 2-9-1 TaxID=797114 RepID=M0D6Z3_9EURY|nr:hypothetical protein [Halosimplex carlsbadense]ELZ30588.1 hypothetical protein C475_00560 [Halosimplex carlsbadense 2-9-1]
MDRTLGYGLVGTIGVSASTIASAIIGDPFPVVVPSIVAGAVVAGHHLRERRAGDGVEHDHADDQEESDDPLGIADEMEA